MNKIVVGIIMGMVFISLTSAINLIAGDSYSFESEQFEFWDVVNNQSNMEGMNISWEDGNTTISFNLLFAPNSFTLIFFNQEKEIITEHHYSGGGSRTKYIDKYTEVPNYIDREVIKIVPGDEEPEIVEKIPTWVYFVFGGLVLIILTLIIIIKRGKNGKRKIDDKRKKRTC